jgi:bifunctional non-homologous end joining protein LigD
MGLKEYTAKRDLQRTPEPGAGKERVAGKDLIFVIHRHKASHLHYDLRLEMEGVLKSWAVPKGPSMAPTDKRLAMQVEDHPFDYKDFKGVIPEGNYGAGIVEIWDRGTYTPLGLKKDEDAEKTLLKGLRSGSLKVVLKGRKLKGEFALVRMKGEEGRSWLLIKHRDEHAVKSYNSEDETPKNSPINKALAKRAGTTKKSRSKVTRSSKMSASPAKKEKEEAGPRRYSVRGLRKSEKVKDTIKPMLASPDVAPFDDTEWLFEVKWDGYRAVAETGAKEPRLYSRNGLSFLDVYPDVSNELRKMRKQLVLDGEIVALNEQDRPDFQLLQHASQDSSTHVVYYVFDLLAVGGKDIGHLPLVERKARLKQELQEGDHVRFTDHVQERGIDFFNAAVQQDLEGIIGKRADSIYAHGVRSKNWVKVKNHQTQEVVIGGYTAPRNSRKHFGALLLGTYKADKLVYAGHTGTGFDQRTLSEVMALMKPLVRKTSPFSGAVDANMPPVWLSPKLVCQVKFTEWTRDGHMRHPVFLGLRPDKDAKTVHKETMAKKTNVSKKVAGEKAKSSAPKKATGTTSTSGEKTNERDVKVGRNTVHLTNLKKVFWPKEGITKGDVLDYYERMHKVLLPHLKDRPQSLYRTPNGMKGSGFFQKDAGGAAPSWVASVKVPSDSRGGDAIDYILCNDLGTLLYLVNLGCIELNPWTSRKGRLLKPDHVVLDLDPSDGNSFDDVVEAALAVQVVLKQIDVVGHCKTSGSSGLHIYIPTGGRYTYDQLAPFAKNMMRVVNQLLPKTTTLERSIAKRGKRQIYLDHLQNRKGQTLASVYSVRPREGATVSTPLLWKEVDTGLDRRAFTMESVPIRVEKMGDLFKDVLTGKGFPLTKAMRSLDALLE